MADMLELLVAAVLGAVGSLALFLLTRKRKITVVTETPYEGTGTRTTLKEHNEDLKNYEETLGKDRNVFVCRLSANTLKSLCGYDPSAVGVSQTSFDPVKQNSNCIFARKSKVWASADYDAALSVTENMDRSLQAFIIFASLQKNIDGFLVDVAYPGAGDTLENHTHNVKQVLSFFSSKDPAAYNCVSKSFVGKRGWVFNFAREEFFITTFAGCYDETNARYAYGVKDHSFILFQPYHSFLYNNVGLDTGETNWDNPQTARDRIRIKFKEHGQPYYIPSDTQDYPMALGIVPPLHLGEQPVEWWK